MELLIPAAAAIIFTWVLILVLFGGKSEHDHGIRNNDQARPVG
jgi:hypothetical protein